MLRAQASNHRRAVTAHGHMDQWHSQPAASEEGSRTVVVDLFPGRGNDVSYHGEDSILLSW